MKHLAVQLVEFLRKRATILAYAVALIAVLLCWAIIISDGGRIKSQDEPGFVQIATNLALNGTFAYENGTPTAYPAPGTMFFLTPFVKLGAGIVQLRMVNALLVGLSLVMMFHLIRRRAGPLAGLIAVVMIPTWPPILYSATTLYPQTLAACLLVLTVLLLDRLTETGSRLTAVSVAVASGSLILTIPITLLLFPVILGWVFFRSKDRLAHILILCIVSASFVGAWTIRNYNAFGMFIPIATSSGYNLLAGNTPGARYNTSLDIRFQEYVYTEITGKNEAKRNKIFTDAAVRAIKQDPALALSRYIGKFAHWFHFSNKLMSDNVVEGGASQMNIGTREVILLVTYVAVIALPLLLHLILIRRFPPKPVEILFLCLWIGAGLAYAIFFTRVRFRAPFDWLIIASNGIFVAAYIEHHIKAWGKDLTK